ncbi:hypothetical protein EPA93_22010 [Ktedonosporobacter rubrisoli]|uniref:Uncharacterized protein n=1 Tax=Ktedonosporobacter rubrisoli TaxID=2509675 RepID=A0A4P6JTD6_KTERU|nr:hypothetical protein [Ktedonosporobacter rubrisoli]QBD78522.1 hypothetical protein EPA93_22010 [Ktedonosporobacter rubrisoli]
MSWFDEAVARRQRALRAAEAEKTRSQAGSSDPHKRQQQEVEAFDPLLQRLLTEYGEHIFGRSFLQKRFIVRLERPASVHVLGDPRGRPKSWNWHWHLDSLVRHMPGVEMHPRFAADGTIHGFILLCGKKRVEISTTDEEAIKEGLVSLYLQ